jgi:hypothetical protein
LVRLALGVLIASVSLAGGAISDAGEPSEKTKSAEISGSGLVIEFPSEWTQIALTKQKLKAQRKKIAKLNPDLADLLHLNRLKSVTPDLKFLAIDIRAPSDSVSVQVVSNAAIPESLEEFLSAHAPLHQAGLKLVNAIEINVAGTRGFRADVNQTTTLADGSSTTTFVSVVSLVHGDGFVLLTAGAIDSDEGVGKVNGIVSSIRGA